MDLEDAILLAKLRKAVGYDLVVAEVFKFAPMLFARMMCGLTTKFSAMLFGPVQSKGGQMLDIYKGAGTQAECKNRRGILVTCALGKTLRTAARMRLLPHAHENFTDTQFGGLPH